MSGEKSLGEIFLEAVISLLVTAVVLAGKIWVIVTVLRLMEVI